MLQISIMSIYLFVDLCILSFWWQLNSVYMEALIINSQKYVVM